MVRIESEKQVPLLPVQLLHSINVDMSMSCHVEMILGAGKSAGRLASYGLDDKPCT